MDWHHKEFDLINEDTVDAHIIKEKGESILRKIAVDSETNNILGEKDTQETEGNCIYDLFKVAEAGKINTDLVSNLSENILKYNLGELNLDIDFKVISNETESNSNLPNVTKTENLPETLEENKVVEAPFCWLLDLNEAYLDFDQSFEEEYLLEHSDFHKVLSQKQSFFFKGKASLIPRCCDGKKANSIFDDSQVGFSFGEQGGYSLLFKCRSF